MCSILKSHHSYVMSQYPIFLVSHEDLSESSKMAESTELMSSSKTLPILEYREELIKAVEESQCVVITGETGCGKTTQLPQYLREAGFDKNGVIGVTQPRRVAAISVAHRVAHETGH